MQASDFTPAELRATDAERDNIAWFFGSISEEEAESILRSQIGTTSKSDEDIMTRRVYLLREVDQFTVVVSVLHNGAYAHVIMDLDLDMVWTERVASGADTLLSDRFAESVIQVLERHGLLECEGKTKAA